MNIEEAKQWIELLRRTMREETSGSYPDSPYKDEVYVALDMAFKALMQMDILDKIRAEIESMDFDFGDYYDHTDEIIEMVCKAIDKHTAENEKVRIGK